MVFRRYGRSFHEIGSLYDCTGEPRDLLGFYLWRVQVVGHLK